MTPETKKNLTIGASIVLAVTIGVFLYRRYQTNTSQGQSDEAQAEEDELEFLAEQAAGGEEDYESAGGTTFSLPTSTTGTDTLGSEITGLLQSLGISTPSSTSTGSSSSSSGSGGSSGGTASSGGTVTNTGTRTVTPPSNPKVNTTLTAAIVQGSEPPVLEMDSDKFL